MTIQNQVQYTGAESRYSHPLSANARLQSDRCDFDFDAWAIAVKQQMLAALDRRGAR